MSWNGYRFDDEGELIPINVYLVWGPPASGKTSYVREHMRNGDMVVDLDLIKQSISMADKTMASDVLLDTAISIRDYIYSLIEKRTMKTDVWVTAGLPTKKERDAVINKIKPDKVVYIDTPQSICVKQANDDNERTNKDKQIEIINKWFRRYYGQSGE